MISFGRNDLIHWNYFIALERDLELVSRFIEFSSENQGTYSIELAKLLMAASAETDVVLKMLCLRRQVEANNIDDYREFVQLHLPTLMDEEVTLSRFSLSSRPWENWKGDLPKNPDWWRSYNKVKHQRNINYSEANLRNVINALGGLLIVLVYYYKELGGGSFKAATNVLEPRPILLSLNSDYYSSFLVTE